MTQPQPQLKTSVSGYGSNSPLSYLKGTVLSVDLTNQVAEIQFPDRRDKVSITARRGKGGIPTAGETWLFDQGYGSWMFAVLLSESQPAPWLAAELLGGWAPSTSYPSPIPGLQKDGAGVVRLRGAVSGGSYASSLAAGPLASDILQLPEGYRPASIYGPVVAASNHLYGELLVLPSGYVRAQVGASWISLAGVSFLAEN